MTPRATGALELRPAGNSQGCYFFCSLISGKNLDCYSCTELPMPSDVVKYICQVNNISWVRLRSMNGTCNLR